tara:strand:- start:67 stop:249 length:183 start_codon:yes stop_codon:yes gene_type:complete
MTAEVGEQLLQVSNRGPLLGPLGCVFGKASDLFGISARREVSNPIDMAVVNFPFVNYFLA